MLLAYYDIMFAEKSIYNRKLCSKDWINREIGNSCLRKNILKNAAVGYI